MKATKASTRDLLKKAGVEKQQMWQSCDRPSKHDTSEGKKN